MRTFMAYLIFVWWFLHANVRGMYDLYVFGGFYMRTFVARLIFISGGFYMRTFMACLIFVFGGFYMRTFMACLILMLRTG